MKKKKLGEILIEEGLITQEQLNNALTLQREQKKRIGKVLISLGYVNDYQIAETISKQLSIPIVDCSNYSPSKELLSLVPKELAESKTIFPLEQKDKNLLIAMADPLDWQATDVVSFGTGLKVTLAVAPEDNILNAIESAYSSAGFTWDILKELPASDEAEFVKEEDIDKKHGVSYQALYKESEAPPISI
jgi:type IV pilus assembly protein PilB